MPTPDLKRIASGPADLALNFNPAKKEEPMLRRTLMISAALFAIAPAAAQQAPLPDPVPMKLPRAMIQAIGNALMKAPYETSAPIFTELQKQLNEADQAALDAGKPKEPVPAGGPQPNPTPSAPPVSTPANAPAAK